MDKHQSSKMRCHFLRLSHRSLINTQVKVIMTGQHEICWKTAIRNQCTLIRCQTHSITKWRPRMTKPKHHHEVSSRPVRILIIHRSLNPWYQSPRMKVSLDSMLNKSANWLIWNECSVTILSFNDKLSKIYSRWSKKIQYKTLSIWSARHGCLNGKHMSTIPHQMRSSDHARCETQFSSHRLQTNDSADNGH